MTTVSESDPAVSRSNIAFVSHSDQGGRGDGVQIVGYNGHVYIGHMFSNGVTVMDVRDPKHPKPVSFIPAPPNTWSIHVQTADDLLLVINAAMLGLVGWLVPGFVVSGFWSALFGAIVVSIVSGVINGAMARD